MNQKGAFLGLGLAAFLSVIYALGAFDRLGYQVYDQLLRFRAGLERERPGDEFVVFLDIDDNAIALNGVFPWPRSIKADALLRLKEFGSKAAIFDIEYIDRSPPGVDTIYLNQGLFMDFSRSFGEINSRVGDLNSAISAGRISLTEAGYHFRELQEIIYDEQGHLFSRVQRIARDNDLYLFEASALFGRSWITLNLRDFPLTDEEQRSRRPVAERLFARPVTASPAANRGPFVDILPAITGFAETAKGAGYTNVVVDVDGTRRRVALAQNVHDHWYLQLAFAPIVYFLGNPDLELCGSSLN